VLLQHKIKLKKRRLSLRANFVFSLIANIIYGGAQWFVLMLMTKLLPAEKVGHFILAMAIVTPIQMFLNFHLRAAQATDARNEYLFGEYLGLRITTATLCVIIVAVISLLLGKDWEVACILIAVGLSKFADGLFDVTYGLVQKYERLDAVAISMAIRAVLEVGVFATVMLITKNVALCYLAIFVAWVIAFLKFDLSSATCFESTVPIFKPDRLRKLAILTLPLGINMALVALNANVPRYLTEKYLGRAQLGYFGALGYAVTALGMAVSALGLTGAARLSIYYVENARAFIWLLVRMVLIALVLAIAGVIFGFAFGHRFLEIVYTQEYAAYNRVFIWLLIGGGVGYMASMLCVGLTAARAFRAGTVLMTAVTCSIVLAGWLLIPRFGFIGAAWSVLIGMSVQFVGAGCILAWKLLVRGLHGTQETMTNCDAR